MTVRNAGDLQATIDKLGLRLTSVFVPFSQSRNKAEKSPSLNWQVTLYRGDVAVLITDYMAGSGHAPSYRHPGFGKKTVADRDRELMVAWECENGRKAFSIAEGRTSRIHGNARDIIQPNTLNVIHSLVMDSDVLDSGGFESWAGEFGYDVDSRKAEKTYQACLEIALKLRNAIGDSGLTKLRNAFAEY